MIYQRKKKISGKHEQILKKIMIFPLQPVNKKNQAAKTNFRQVLLYQTYIQGVFFTGPLPKKLKYGKPRLGEVREPVRKKIRDFLGVFPIRGGGVSPNPKTFVI